MSDATSFIQPTAGTPAGMLLNGMAKGAGPTDRLGQQVMLKSIDLRVSFAAPHLETTDGPSATIRPLTVRVLLLYLNSPNATAFSTLAPNCFEAGGNPLTMMNLAYRRNFKVIADKQMVLMPQSVVKSDTPGSDTFSAAQGGQPVCNIKIRRNINLS